MAETFNVGGVIFTFYVGGRATLTDPPNQMVEIMIEDKRRELPLWLFNREMFPLSEEAARRSTFRSEEWLKRKK